MPRNQISKADQVHNRINENIPIHFLVYTRSSSFDYQWIYGLNDASTEQKLEDHLLAWLNTNQLAKLKSVTAFFQFNNYYALMLAQGSETRRDLQGRQIFQRALYLWEPTDGLYYRHLEPLTMMLAEEAERVYGELPNNAYSFQKKTQQYKINIYALEEEVSTVNIKECSWKLPLKLKWQDVVRDNLTVEVPNSWRFDKIIAGLADHPLSPRDAVYIGHSLHTDNRFPMEHSWIISSANSNGESDDSIRILKANGQLLQEVTLKDDQGKRKLITSKDQRLDDLSTHAEVEQISPESTTTPPEQAVSTDIEPTSQIKTKSDTSDAVVPTELERLFNQYTNTSPNKDKWEFTRIIKKILDRDQLPIVEAETRILLLLTPATQKMPQEIIIAWQYLLNEVLLSFQHPVKEMIEEWLRRLSELERITVKNSIREFGSWPADFSEACNAFRAILKKL